MQSRPVLHLPARQGRARLHRQAIGQTLGIAKGHDPGIVHEQEIQHGGQEFGALRRPRHTVDASPRRAKEYGEQLVIARKPSQNPQRQRFCRFHLHAPDLPQS